MSEQQPSTDPVDYLRVGWPDTAAPIQETVDAVVVLVRQMGEALRPLIDAVVDLGEILLESIYQGYTAAGKPYGDTPEGMMHWVHEQLEHARRTMDAEDARERETRIIRMRA